MSAYTIVNYSLWVGKVSSICMSMIILYFILLLLMIKNKVIPYIFTYIIVYKFFLKTCLAHFFSSLTHIHHAPADFTNSRTVCFT